MKSRIAQVCVVVLTGLIAVPLLRAVPTPPHVNPLAAQAKAVADAKVKVDQARAAILTIRRRVALVFEVKPDFKAARELADRTKSDYDAAGRKIVATLEKSPAFVALVTKRNKAQAVMDSALVSASTGSEDAVKVTPEDISAAATDRQTAVLAMRKMEKDAQDADANYATLKQKAADADAAWKVLELQVDDAVKLDPAYPPAAQALETAEAAYKQANDAYRTAQKALVPPPKAPIRR